MQLEEIPSVNPTRSSIWDVTEPDEDFEPSAEEIKDSACIVIESRAFAGGGFAEIFRGQWRPPGKTTHIRVAVKVLRFSGLINPAEENEQLERIDKRLQREMRVWGKLKHPHIVPLLGFMRARNNIIPDNNPCLVSSYYAFGDLSYYLKNYPEANSLALLCQAAEGLQYLHSHTPPIAHLDIKAQNILINNRRQAQICDFGVSRVLEDIKTGLTTQGPIGYTINFACPEVLLGDQMTSAADVFSFAGLVLHTLSGNRPYYRLGAYVGRITLAISTGKVPLQTDHDIQMPSDALLELWGLLNLCWRPDPSQRPAMTDVMKKLKLVQYLKSLHEDHPSHNAAMIRTTISAEMHSLEQTIGTKVEEIKSPEILTTQPLPFARGFNTDIFEGSWLPPGKTARIKVAVKVLRVFGTYDTPQQHEQLARVTNRLGHEIRVWGKLNHPRIVPLLAYIRSSNHTILGDNLCLIYPLYRFRNLSSYLKSYPGADRLALLCQAAEGLNYLHTFTPPIVHLGIKAENILVNDLEEAEICDFGVSRVLGDIIAGSSKPGDAGYTMNFVCPELLAGDEATPSADVFSFAGLVLQILSGNPPYYKLGASVGKIGLAISLGKIPVEGDHEIFMHPAALRQLWSLLEHCWSTEPQQRPVMADVMTKLDTLRYLESLGGGPPKDGLAIGTKASGTSKSDVSNPEPMFRELANPCSLRIAARPFSRAENGEVFLGQWLPPNGVNQVQVAVKVLRFSGMRNTAEAHDQLDRLEERLQQAMQIRSGLAHPHLVPLLGYLLREPSQSFEGPCLVSPFYGLGNIELYLRRRPEADRLALLRQAAEGLSYLHMQTPSLLHLNLSVKNILINDQGEAAISDFGISAIMDELTQGHPSSRGEKNNVCLLCPETLEGSPGTTAADVYSFAGLILKVLSGRLPYYYLGQRVGSIVLCIVNGRTPIRANYEIHLHPNALDRVWNLLNDCWQMEPLLRPSMAHVIKELELIRDVAPSTVTTSLDVAREASGPEDIAIEPPVSFYTALTDAQREIPDLILGQADRNGQTATTRITASSSKGQSKSTPCESSIKHGPTALAHPIRLLRNALERIRVTPPRLINPPTTQPRLASVAIIIHLIPARNSRFIQSDQGQYDIPQTLDEFFGKDWVNETGCDAELVYIRRRHPSGSQGEGSDIGRETGGAQEYDDIAFPGGRSEPGDEDALYTGNRYYDDLCSVAIRQTWEEIGIDLAGNEWLLVGQLDDREITTSLGKRLPMVLSPFVFLHLTPYTLRPILPSPCLSASLSIPSPPTLHSIPFAHLLSPDPTWSHITVDISSRLVPLPKHGIWTKVLGSDQMTNQGGGVEQPARSVWLSFVQASVQLAVRTLVGDMEFSALVLKGRVLKYGRGVSGGNDDDDATWEDEEEEDWWVKTPSGKYRKVAKALQQRKAQTQGQGKEKDELKLWGLTLGMTLDLLSFMQPHPAPRQRRFGGLGSSGAGAAARSRSTLTLFSGGSGLYQRRRAASVSAAGVPISPSALDVEELLLEPEVERVWTPSMASVFPRFSIPDVNFWIWVFGKRYREVIRGWDASTSPGGNNDRRISWSDQALFAFYAAVRKALVVMIVLRCLGVLTGLGVWVWVYKRMFKA